MPESNNDKRYTFHVDPKLVDKLKDIAYWERKTLKEVVGEAFRLYILRMEKKKGNEYAARERELKGRRTNR